MTKPNGTLEERFARLTGLCLAISAASSSDMKKSLVFHICGVLCSILLVSPSATCLSLQKLDKQDIPEGSRGFNDAANSQSYAGDFLLPTQSTTEKEMYNMSSYVTSSDTLLAVPEDSQNRSSLLSNNTVTDMSPENNNLGLVIKEDPTGQTKTSSENRILTTAGSTVVYITSVTALSEPTKGDPEKTADKNNTDLKQSILENSSQANTMEMLTTNPRTSIVKTKYDQSTRSSHLDDQLLTSASVETLSTSQNPIGLKTATLVNKNNDSIDFTISQINEDWDDTKFTAESPKKVGSGDGTSPGPDQFMATDNSDTQLFTKSPGMVIPSDDNIVFSATEYMLVTVPEAKVSAELSEPITTPSVSPQTELNSIHMVTISTQVPDIVIEMTQSQELSATYTGVKQPISDISENSSANLTVAILDVTESDNITRDPKVIHKGEETVINNITPHVQNSTDETNTGPSTTVLSVEISTTEGLNLQYKDEKGFVVSASPVVMTQAEDTTVLGTVTSASQVSVILPPTRRTTATAAYGVDKLEYEEGDEEDEEEEDEDDDELDEDDEEEEEDEKDNDSVDDSSEKDSDLPLFTLPGLSSQEPLEDDGNVALIEGAAYQVPDTMEWEQQNQGLVRSWMEKLKDKAGYMSGMLIPVGVGIAGALFILGVLYSIKIMNRRRRNGFKRHKRKREFNSMQDRVMLLADSSEDEF
ncbi:armadillo-like helical domain-containing protein 4 isoform X2 [Mixophyes fleayi]|uniref:armadillo-like helical domain-containing protein 4 isoform X2 n=1 Tax=Mixophyes fleayi TaxID=3061075 RepID=UPI003F4D8B7B